MRTGKMHIFQEPGPATRVRRQNRTWTSPKTGAVVRSLLSVLLIATGALASRLEAAASRPAATPLDARLIVVKDDLLAQRAVTPPEERSRRPEAHLPREDRRLNPAVAGLLSAAVPGAGQIYNGSKMAYLFLGIESAAWLAHFSLRDTGLDKEKQFKSYADAHWSFDRYRDPGFEDCAPEGHSDANGKDSLLVDMFQHDRDSYYDAIGRQTIYSCGWDSPASRNVFRDLQVDSNQFMSNAKVATSIIFVNHLVSAVHAARGAAQHNARLKDRGQIEVEWSLQAFNRSARVKVSRYF